MRRYVLCKICQQNGQIDKLCPSCRGYGEIDRLAKAKRQMLDTISMIITTFIVSGLYDVLSTRGAFEPDLLGQFIKGLCAMICFTAMVATLLGLIAFPESYRTYKALKPQKSKHGIREITCTVNDEYYKK